MAKAETAPHRADTALSVSHGEIVIRRNARARRLILRIDPATARPVLTAPPGASVREIDRFLAANRGWIRRRLAGLPQRVRLEPGSSFPLRGRTMGIRHEPSAPRRPFLEETTIVLGGPAELVEPRLLRWLKQEARTDLDARAQRLAAELGVSYSAVAIRDTTSRWGSCSPHGRLSFAWRLILAPPDVTEYVAAHEVAHLREMNHSPRFWRLVETLVGDPRPRQAWLKVNGPGLFAIGPPRQTRSSRASS